MNSGELILVIGIFFFLVNVHWNNTLFEKKKQLEERERKLNKQTEEDKNE
jgi:hypothetical protein